MRFLRSVVHALMPFKQFDITFVQELISLGESPLISLFQVLFLYQSGLYFSRPSHLTHLQVVLRWWAAVVVEFQLRLSWGRLPPPEAYHPGSLVGPPGRSGPRMAASPLSPVTSQPRRPSHRPPGRYRETGGDRVTCSDLTPERPRRCQSLQLETPAAEPSPAQGTLPICLLMRPNPHLLVCRT